MGRIVRAKPYHPRPGAGDARGDDGRGASVRSQFHGPSAVAEWSSDGGAVSASLAAARARYAATVVESSREPDSIRGYAIRLARLSGLRLDDVRQLTVADAAQLVRDLRGTR